MSTAAIRGLAAGVAALVLGSIGAAAPADAAKARGGAACGEACLKGVMDRYLDALARHDVKAVPAAPRYRYTENAAEIRLGEGLWATFNKWGPYRHDAFDPSTGGVVSYLSLTENHEIPFDDLLAVRLKVVGGKITEIETVLSRHARAAVNLPPKDPSWMEIMNRIEPPKTRLTRAQLIEGSIGYMRAVAFADGELAPFAESCIRLENGNITAIGANDASPVPVGNGPPIGIVITPGVQAELPPLMGSGCGKQLNYRSYAFITGYEDAHFPIVDVERQIVFSTFNFMRRGDVESWTYKGNVFPMPQAMREPNEMLNTEYFKFVDGKISRVEAVFGGPQAYKLGTGWPGGTKAVSRPVGK